MEKRPRGSVLFEKDGKVGAFTGDKVSFRTVFCCLHIGFFCVCLIRVAFFNRPLQLPISQNSKKYLTSLCCCPGHGLTIFYELQQGRS